jgi:hypothetical protein
MNERIADKYTDGPIYRQLIYGDDLNRVTGKADEDEEIRDED